MRDCARIALKMGGGQEKMLVSRVIVGGGGGGLNLSTKQSAREPGRWGDHKNLEMTPGLSKLYVST